MDLFSMSPDIHNGVSGHADIKKILPQKSLNDYPTSWNCAEQMRSTMRCMMEQN